MIQAVADDDERGALGMHYTQRSEHPEGAKPTVSGWPARAIRASSEDKLSRKLLNLRKRMSNIRVFDPCLRLG